MKKTLLLLVVLLLLLITVVPGWADEGKSQVGVIRHQIFTELDNEYGRKSKIAMVLYTCGYDEKAEVLEPKSDELFAFIGRRVDELGDPLALSAGQKNGLKLAIFAKWDGFMMGYAEGFGRWQNVDKGKFKLLCHEAFDQTAKGVK